MGVCRGTDRHDDRRPPNEWCGRCRPGRAAGSQQHRSAAVSTTMRRQRRLAPPRRPVADSTRRIPRDLSTNHPPQRRPRRQVPRRGASDDGSACGPAGRRGRPARPHDAAYTEKVNAALQAGREGLAYELAEQTFVEEVSGADPADRPDAANRRTPHGTRSHDSRPPRCSDRLTRGSVAYGSRSRSVDPGANRSRPLSAGPAAAQGRLAREHRAGTGGAGESSYGHG